MVDPGATQNPPARPREAEEGGDMEPKDRERHRGPGAESI